MYTYILGIYITKTDMLLNHFLTWAAYPCS